MSFDSPQLIQPRVKKGMYSLTARLAIFDFGDMEVVQQKMEGEPTPPDVMDLHCKNATRQKRIVRYWIELTCASIYQIAIICFLAANYGKDEILCDKEKITDA